MKAKKIAIAVLLSLVMIVSSFLVVACDNTKENRWDILTSNANLWSVGDRNIYDINTTGGKLVLDYTKTDTYQYVSGPLGAEEKESYKTFVLTASMTTTAEWSTLLVKFGDGADAREFNFELSSTEKTYEIDVSDYDLASKNVILLFADAGWRDVTGKITISEMYLTDRDINEANRATAYQLPAGSPLPETAAWNQITAESKTVNAGWYDDGRGIYKVDAQNQDGSYTVHGKRKTHQEFWYNALLAFVYSDAETMSAINSFKLTVKAPAGTLIAVKPFDFYEVQATVPDDLDNEEFTIEVDVSGFTQAKVNDEQGNPTEEFAHKFAKTDKVAEAQAQNKIYVIWETGNGSAEGDFTIVKAEFSTDKAVPMYTAKEITETDGKVSTEWFSYDFGVYTPSLNATDNSVNVHYVKGNLEWPYMYTYVKGAALQNMTTLTIKVKGPEGVGFLVKPYDRQKDSYFLTFTGSEQTEVLDISGLNADWNSDLKILFFVGVTSAGGGEKGLSGEFTIYSMEFGKGTVTPSVDPDLNVITADNTKITKGWKPLDAGTYTVTEKGEGFNVEFNKTDTYQFLRTYVKGSKIMDFDTLRFTVKGENGKEILFKFLDKELRFEMTGGNDVFDLGYVEKLANKNLEQNLEVLICANSQDNLPKTGSFELISVEFVETYNEITADNHKVTGGWRPLDKDKDYYTVTKQAEGTGFDVTYKKVDTYNFLFTNVLGSEIANMNKITFKVKGTAGKEILFKFVNKEQRETLSGGEDTFTLDFSANKGGVDFTTIQQLLIVIESSTEGAAEGTFSILDVEFTA